VRRISWTHQSFENIGDLDGKSLRASETLFSGVYAGCLCIGCVYARYLCTGCVQYAGCQCIGSVQWINSWRFVVELMTSC
jgi:hypothetical protein